MEKSFADQWSTGSIVPVVRGLFRNTWLPGGKAEYLPSTYGVSGSKAEAERDHLFGREEEVIEDASQPELEDSTPRVRKALPKTISVRRLTNPCQCLGRSTDVYATA